MGTENADGADRSGWSAVSLRVAGLETVDLADFKAIVARLPQTSGIPRNRALERGKKIWVTKCPLQRDSPLRDKVDWAIQEAQQLFGSTRSELAECVVEMWIGIEFEPASMHVVKSTLIRALAALEIDLVFDLYAAMEDSADGAT